MPEPQREPAWHAMRRRVRGEAHVSLVGHMLGPETTLSLSRLAGDHFSPVSEGWPSDGVLETGHYLLRAERVGLATATVAFTLERDTKPQIFVPQLNVAELGEDEVMIANAAQSSRPFALARTEMSGAAWKRLRALLTPEQLSDFTGIESDHLAAPVRNLSFRQARALAALDNGHLPSQREIECAARAHAPASAMPFPWGGTFDKERVSADPTNSSQTEPVDARAEGASPFAVLQLVGNVAEFLSVGADGVVRTHGGDHLSQPEQVRIGATEVVDGFVVQKARAGVRVARFLYPPHDDDVAAAEAAGAHFEKLSVELAGVPRGRAVNEVGTE